MKLLSEQLTTHFKENPLITISTSEDYGEGEHKIFELMRKKHRGGLFNKDDQHIIYGLDSDLIMISMLHIDIVPNLFLFRETPHYIKTIDPTLEDNENYILNISELSHKIIIEMGYDDINIIYDYVFISFMLGNDFLPHFPALNIRTGGIDKIIRAYNDLHKRFVIIDRNENKLTIFWDNYRDFIQNLYTMEESYIKAEFSLRERKSKYKYPDNTPENKLRKFENIPSIDRSVEEYINPFSRDWEVRYYETLLNDGDKHSISSDYIKGLSWNMTYYTFGCIDWEWCYKYKYPPLLKDLVLNIPTTEKILYLAKPNKITPLEQLCYVLPKTSLVLLPDNIREKIKKEWYINDCSFTWAFCKYFWECHVELPEIDFNELRELIKN
jgi:5'-3' exonuclease